jgi:NADH:ubiquinone oxidoreductase subunit 6 (subunit J)
VNEHATLRFARKMDFRGAHMYAMYIVAIGWLYVVVLMAFTAKSFISGLMTFVWFGLLPLALLLWVVGTPSRKRKRLSLSDDHSGKPDRTDAEND